MERGLTKRRWTDSGYCFNLPLFTFPDLLLRWNVEVDEFAAEAPRLPCAERNSDGHPHGSSNLGGMPEIQPQRQTDEEAKKWRKEMRHLLLLAPQEVVGKRREVHSHKRNQR